MTKWISVKERLPVDNHDILLYCICENENRIFGGYYCNSTGTFIIKLPSLKFDKEYTDQKDIEFDYWQVTDNDKFNKITHWTPLPDAPE